MVHLKLAGPGKRRFLTSEKNHLQLPGPVILDPLNWIGSILSTQKKTQKP